MSRGLGLVGDIGGTHARFALAELGRGRAGISEPRIYDNRDYPSAEAAIEAYLGDAAPSARPERVVLAVAGPVTDGRMDFTNSDWELSERGLRREGRFRAARLINDFAAQALGAPRVAPDGLRRIGPEVEGERNGTLAVLGPGTGFGLAGLVRQGGGEVVLATEGGHAGFAPADETDAEILRLFSRSHGRVSVERVLSGHGLYELYLAMGAIEGLRPMCTDERQVQQSAREGETLAKVTIDRFCRILGSAAGDIALTLGARGGVYVTGGVAVSLADEIVAGGFRGRFEAKGRFEDYMRQIPAFLVLEPYAALIGAASLLDRLEAA